jgi:hypothetical protein
VVRRGAQGGVGLSGNADVEQVSAEFWPGIRYAAIPEADRQKIAFDNLAAKLGLSV